MPNSELKMVYRFSIIFGVLSLVISSLAFILYALNCFPSDIQTYMKNGALMFFYLLITLGTLILIIGIYAYKQYKKVEGKIKEQEKNLNTNNENSITWNYSDEDIAYEIKDITRDYTKKSLVVYGLLTILILTPENLKRLISGSYISTIVLYYIIFIIYLFVLIYRRNAILSAPKKVIFTKDFISYDNRTLFIDNQLGHFMGVKYDEMERCIVFCFEESYIDGRKSISSFKVYIPSDKESEVNSIIEMYNNKQ